MNQIKFTLAGILTIATALLFGYVCFLGNYFSSVGNTGQSIGWGLATSALLTFTALGAKHFKRAKGSFRINRIFEYIVLGLYTALMIFFSYRAFSHYFVVAPKKQAIQSALGSNIGLVEKMFTAYEGYCQNRETNYRSTLGSIVAARTIRPTDFTTAGFKSDIPENTQINQKITSLRNELLPSNYTDSTKSGIKDVASSWLSASNGKVNGWRPIGIVDVSNNVEKNALEWRNMLTDLSKYRERGDTANDFSYNLDFGEVKGFFTKRERPTLLGISLSVAAWLMMLLPWFVTKRDSRGVGARQLKEYEVVL